MEKFIFRVTFTNYRQITGANFNLNCRSLEWQVKSTCAVALRNTFRVKARPEPGVRLQLPPAAAAAAPAEAADPNPQTFSKIVKIMTI